MGSSRPRGKPGLKFQAPGFGLALAQPQMWGLSGESIAWVGDLFMHLSPSAFQIKVIKKTKTNKKPQRGSPRGGLTLKSRSWNSERPQGLGPRSLIWPEPRASGAGRQGQQYCSSGTGLSLFLPRVTAQGLPRDQHPSPTSPSGTWVLSSWRKEAQDGGGGLCSPPPLRQPQKSPVPLLFLDQLPA